MRKNENVDDAISDFLRNEKDEPNICPKCGKEMDRVGRTVSWCPRCRMNRLKQR